MLAMWFRICRLKKLKKLLTTYVVCNDGHRAITKAHHEHVLLSRAKLIENGVKNK